MMALTYPFMFFKNRINPLMNNCPFEGARLTLLQADCARTAARTIANFTFDTPGISEKDSLEMFLERLSLRLGVRGWCSRSLKLGSIAMVINWPLTAAIPVTRFFGKGLSALRELNRGIKGHSR